MRFQSEAANAFVREHAGADKPYFLFVGYGGVRTTRFTYVRDSDGPWLLYDNQDAPCQMNNLIDSSEYDDIQTELEQELQNQLNQNGDDFPAAEEALTQWGYTVTANGNIPYCGEFKVQSPGADTGEICHF